MITNCLKIWPVFLLIRLPTLLLSSPIFVVDTINRDYLIREFQLFRIDDISDPDVELHIKRELNLESSSMEEEWKFYDKRSNRGEKRNEKA